MGFWGFGVLGIWYVFKWIDKNLAYYALLAICILNLSYTYDTIIWGQMDGTLSALVFLAMYFVWKGANIWGALLMVLAFNFKIQSIVIVPVWGLLFINNYLTSRKIKDLALPILAAGALQGLLFLPFTWGQYSIGKILHVISGSFNKYHSISVKAPNIWHWLVKGNLLYADDSKIWIAGLTYKQIGLILFFAASFFALLPMIILVFKNIRAVTKIKISRELVWTSGAMVYLLFYFFNTEIHERYCHPAFIFITAYAFYTREYLVYILFSFMYFMTLEFSMQHLRLANYDIWWFNLKFLAVINAFIIIYLAGKIRKYYRVSLQKLV